MGGALWKEFYLNILSKLWCSSKILFKQLRWHGFYPLGKRQSKIAKKLSKWEQYEENLFSFKLPSEKFLAIGKNRTACLIKGHPVIFIEGAYDRFLLNGVETKCFFNFDGRLPRSGGAWTEESGGSKLTEGSCCSSNQGNISLQSKFFLINCFLFPSIRMAPKV